MKTVIRCAAAAALFISMAYSAAAGQKLEHAMGVTELPVTPKRIVTLTNEATEAVLALGIKPVGATQSWYGDPWYPHLENRLDGTEVLGTELAVNLERVAVLQPDLILGSKKRHEDIYSQLSAFAPTVFSQSNRDWKANVALYAKALGIAEAGTRLLEGHAQRSAALKTLLGDNIKERVSVVRFVPGQTYLYQQGSFSGNILKEVGFARPSPQDEDGLALAVGRESIPDMNGDRLFWLTYDTGDGEGDAMADSFLKDALWTSLPVVKADRVHNVSDSVWATAGGIYAAQAMLDDIAKTYDVPFAPTFLP